MLACLLLFVWLCSAREHRCQHRPKSLIYANHTFTMAKRHRDSLASDHAKRQSANTPCDDTECEPQPVRIYFDKTYLPQPGKAVLDDQACSKVGESVQVDAVGDDGESGLLRCTADMLMTNALL